MNTLIAVGVLVFLAASPCVGQSAPVDQVEHIQWKAKWQRSGCAPVSPARVRRLLDRHPRWSDDVITSVACRQVDLGMSAVQVREAWGEPLKVRRVRSHLPDIEQWVYRDGRSVVFNEEGRVTAAETQ